MLRRSWIAMLKGRDFRIRAMIKKKMIHNTPAASLAMGDTEFENDSSGPVNRSQRRRVRLTRLGSDVANEARMMTDAEWEATSLEDKHAFTKYIAKKLRDAPSTVSEQQRRRYYETTALDPRDENPARTVMDITERIRLGLPTRMTPDRRQLGVTEAVYEQGDATLFDPGQAHRIEHAVTELKQMFVDYVRKKKEGVSTEHERRALAAASEELHFQTQKHLANMFKYAEAKTRDIILEERLKQLRHIAAVRRYLKKQKSRSGGAASKDASGKDPATAADTAAPSTSKPPSEAKLAKKKKKSSIAGGSRADRVKRVLRDTYGLDVDTAKAVWEQMMAQERFLRLCEVMTRMTLGTGFRHTQADESLDEYTAKLRDLYSASPERLGTIDAVQYLAATEGVPPVDWATRWYEKALLLPIQMTPEYAEVQRIKEEEEAVARAAQVSLAASGTKQTTQTEVAAESSSTGEEGSPAAQPDATAAQGDGSSAEASTDATTSSSMVVVPDGPGHRATARAASLVAKMFLPPDDPRLASQHERRLRYIAHLHLESQVKRLRQNAHLFEGVENTEEAERCRALYASIQERKEALRTDEHASDAVKANPFFDPAIRSAFEEIQSICAAVIKSRLEQAHVDSQAARAGRIADALSLGKPEAIEDAVRESRRQKKEQQLTRMLRLVEKDVREDMVWLDNMNEADRPAPLPIPEPMSYISAGDVQHWKSIREAHDKEAGNPFANKSVGFRASFMGQPWRVPDKPELFWGTGAKAVEQALKHAEQDAERRRGALPGLPPPYPCAENPWGWRLRQDVLDEELPVREAERL